MLGAATSQQELEGLGVAPLPSLRTIERILERASLTCPPVRLARRLAQTDYPGPQAHDSNQLHQVDIVGPRHLKGDQTPYYFLVCKGAFDQAISMEFVRSREREGVLTFLIRA